MKTSDFYYDLPKELIAQDPLEDRSSSRLLVLHRKSGRVEHRVFTDIVEYLKPGDCLVRNNTKVIPARLYGTRVDTGATIELLLLKRMENDVWETLVKPGKKARQGAVISFGDGILTGEIIDVKEDGNRLIQFRYEGIFEEILDQLGQMPLPPYITHTLKDKNRYQTVYAKYEGSAAAPTAGLHFTEELFQKLEEKGVLVANVTLHVGLGTFRPVKVDDVSKHHMHTEFYQVTKEEADKINKAKQAGGRIVCVGTTSCRTIESAADENGRYRYFHLSGLFFQNDGCADYEFSFAGINAFNACFCTCRKRAGYACVRRSSAGEIPVLLVWRCDDYIGRLVRDFYGKRKGIIRL